MTLKIGDACHIQNNGCKYFTVMWIPTISTHHKYYDFKILIFNNISSIDIGTSEDELFITFSNYGVSSVWMSQDGGVNWIEKESR